jgi:hypothetical protein
LSPPVSTRDSTSLSSFSALGWMLSSVAMRSITSERVSADSCCRMLEAWSRSRCTRMEAMICGCSWRISSATEAASIQRRLSMPETSLPCTMRSISMPALSSPSARFSTPRT